MKIALIYPSKRSDQKQMPLGIGYLASYVLSKNDDVEIKALDTGIATEKETRGFYSGDFGVVGISVTSRSYREGIQIAKTFKESRESTLIVFGGPHVSIVMQEIMKEPLIDFAVYGEGELTLDELIKVLRKADNHPNTEALAKINGLIYRNDNHETVVNPHRELIQDIDALPFPAFHLFPIESYPGKHQMITSRGCPYSCVYCASSCIWKRKWRARSPENIVAEMQYLARNFRRRPIDFHDDNFNLSRRRVNAICDLLMKKKLKIPWSLWGFRADVVDSDIARKMRQAGCTNVAVGVESANNEMLRRMGKKISIEQIDRCINTLHSAGIDVIGQFMVGNPGETLETVKESIKFVKESKLSKSLWGCAVPFPNTGLWDYVKEHGRFLVEPDCTRFEEITPKIIFETPEFTKEDRLEALRLLEKAEILPGKSLSKNLISNLEKTGLRIWFKYLYGYLPTSVSYKLYFFLRKLKAKLPKLL